MIVTPDPEVARTARLLRNQGMEVRYANEIVGFNARMTEMSAAIGRVQLRKLAAWTLARQRNAKILDARLAGVGGVAAPVAAPEAVHVYHQYTVRIGADRDGVAERLTGYGIGSGVYYPTPTHRLPSFDLALDLPETERAAREVLSLPVHPALSRGDVEAVVTGLTKAVAG